MKRFILITVLFYAVFFTLISYSVSKAYFADMAITSSNSFTAAETFPTITPTPTGSETSPGKVVINEVSPSGGNDDDWVELFNSGGSTVSITGWKIQDNDGADILPGMFSIPSGGYAVIVASGSAVSVPGGVQKIELTSVQIGSSGLALGGDRLILLNDTNATIDSVSYGSNTTVFTLASPSTTQTLRRIPNGTDTDNASNWQAGAGSIGASN